MKTQIVDTLKKDNDVIVLDDLTPEEKAYWLKSIERDLNNENTNHRYYTLDEFEQKLMEAVHNRL